MTSILHSMPTYSVAPMMAQITTPQGFRYVLHAENHLGFLVERRYRRVAHIPDGPGYPVGDNWYEPYFHPFVNMDDIARSRMGYEDVEQWITTHPGEVFTHPVYASFCLRWGDNTGDWQVYPCGTWQRTLVPTEWALPMAPQPLWVIPHTAWRSGRTYYQLEVLERNIVSWSALANAGLAQHDADLEGEGQWRGFYTCDWSEMQAVAERLPTPRVVVLQCPALPRFRVQIYQAPGWLREERLITTIEQAWALYAAAPAADDERTSSGAHIYPRLIIAREDEVGAWWPFAEKAIEQGVLMDHLSWSTPALLVPRSAWGPTYQPLSSSLQHLLTDTYFHSSSKHDWGSVDYGPSGL